MPLLTQAVRHHRGEQNKPKSNDLDYYDNGKIGLGFCWCCAMVLEQEFSSDYQLEIHVPSYRPKQRSQHTWTALDAVHSDYPDVWIVAQPTCMAETYCLLSSENTDFS